MNPTAAPLFTAYYTLISSISFDKPVLMNISWNITYNVGFPLSAQFFSPPSRMSCYHFDRRGSNFSYSTTVCKAKRRIWGFAIINMSSCFSTSFSIDVLTKHVITMYIFRFFLFLFSQRSVKTRITWFLSDPSLRMKCIISTHLCTRTILKIEWIDVFQDFMGRDAPCDAFIALCILCKKSP